MKFNNIENPCLDLKDGGKIWKSRNVAVSIIVINQTLETSKSVYLVKRGKDMTHAGKWCFPCGYLDWNETVEEAAIREVYEETGIISSIENLKFMGIDSDPNKFMQNVSVRFLIENGESLKLDENHSIDFGEVEDAKWFDLNNLPEMAFDHKETCEHYNKTKSLNTKP